MNTMVNQDQNKQKDLTFQYLKEGMIGEESENDDSVDEIISPTLRTLDNLVRNKTKTL